VAAPVNDQGVIDTKRLLDAKKAGFTVVNRDGKELFCQVEDITGSHVRTKTVCMTESEMDAQISQTQVGMQSYMHANAPISGK
jgi:hypothetical protein